ncbi:MAG: hypothetical protein RLZZ303_1291 [Candidatus Hydrogenedentota bacterium]|jgi:dihydroflavonol-4-reductase
MGKTLVTGATGLVGYNIARVLLERGRRVVCLVRDVERARAIVPSGCDLIAGDVTSRPSLDAALDDVDVVYHAAGLPEQWLRNADLFRQVNVEGTRNMAEASLEAGVRRFVYTSTIDVFQAGRGEAYDESVLDPQPKCTAYERSKQEADRVAVAVMKQGLNTVFLHPSGVYGPGPLASPGINQFLIQLSKGEIPLLLPGGFPVVYSEDVGLGHVLAEEKAKSGERFILSARYYELAELAELAKPLLGMSRVPPIMPLWLGKLIAVAGEGVSSIIGQPPLIPLGQLQFMQWQAQPQNRRAIERLGWEPTPFDEGLRKTVDFLRGIGEIK